MKAVIERHGAPDVVQVRRIFIDSKSAKDWEDRVLVRLKVKKSARWINASNPRSFKGIVIDDVVKAAISEKAKGRFLGSSWYNDGVKSRLIRESEEVPEGWKRGRALTDKMIRHFRELNERLTHEQRSAATKGRLLGVPKPPGTGSKISASLTGRKRPFMEGENNPAKRPEVRKKISDAKRKKVPNSDTNGVS